MPLRLSFDTGPLAGIHIVTSSPTLRLGRDPQSNDILLTNPKVSRKHAVIMRSVRGGYALEVLGTGPSRLNGDLIAAVGGRPTVHALSTGDHLEFGGVELTVSEATVKLIAVAGPSAGRELVIDGTVRIGRGGDCDLVLDDRDVEPEHLVLSSTPLGFRAEPRAAMWINGQPGEIRVLAHGDELQLGRTTLRFTAQAFEDLSPETSMSSAFIPRAATDQIGELVIIAGANKGQRIPLGNEQIIIGTRADCTVMLSDIAVSPLHCAVSKSGDQFVATDLGSEHGTMINGERITHGTALQPGDLIAIGIHVLEARLVGGVAGATRGAIQFATMLGDSADGPQPRFVLDGRVVMAARIAFGRAPTCDVIIDDPSVSREHCIIDWASGFAIRDTSIAGTYVDDKRVVGQPLPPSSVLRIRDTLFRVAIRGEVCTIERADAALAQAALDVARAHASQLTRGMHSSDVHGAVAAPMKTLFRMDAGAIEHEIAARKKDLRRGAPAWRPSSDLASNRPMRGAIALSVLAALALGGGAMVFGKGSALVNHPISQGHASAAFAAKATGTTVCGACHSSANRIDSARCAGCHGDFGPRRAHADLGCAGCHREHRGPSADRALHAQDSCARCHPQQHLAEFVPAAVPQKLAAGPLPDQQLSLEALHAVHSRIPVDAAGVPIRDPAAARPSGPGGGAAPSAPAAGTPATGPAAAAGTAPAAGTRGSAAGGTADRRGASAAATATGRSQAGAVVTGSVIAGAAPAHVADPTDDAGERAVGIGCTACHAKQTGAALAQGNAGLSCFRCHDGGAAATRTGCERCHAREHPSVLARLAPGDKALSAAVAVPSPLGSLGWALAIGLVGGAPGILFGGWLRLRRRRTADAMVDDLKAHPAEVVKRLVHSINDSKCVGCALCVQACPASVLELVEHKSRVVNFDSCIQCKKCEHACAFDALRMHDADKPPPMVPMPSIDAFHETPIAGMFLIGQASGTPQVKNATNLGRAVIQRMVQQGVRPGIGRAAGCEVDVAIVGSGPAGLSAAITCIELGLSYAVLEKERAFAWTIRNYYHKGKEVMAEPHDVGLEASLPHWDTSREELLGAWQQLVDQHRIAIHYQHHVLDVKPSGDRFTLVIGNSKAQPVGELSCARVVIAIGTLGNPRKLGCPGDDLEKVKNSLVDPDEWVGKNILVVGGSDSAVEVVLALSAPERRNQVWFSTRGAKLEGIKPKNRKLIEDALAAGRFQMRNATQVAEVSPTSVVLTYKEDGRREQLANEVVFAMIGGNSPQKWLQQIGIPYVDKPHSWSPPRTDLLSQKTAEGLSAVRRLVRDRLGLS